MFSGTNVILSTNNEAIVGILSSELVQLRNIDSILIRNYKDTISTVENDKPQAIIMNCQNSIEEPLCLDLIEKIKKYGFNNIIIQEGTALCYAHIGHDAFMISFVGDD